MLFLPLSWNSHLPVFWKLDSYITWWIAQWSLGFVGLSKSLESEQATRSFQTWKYISKTLEYLQKNIWPGARQRRVYLLVLAVMIFVFYSYIFLGSVCRSVDKELGPFTSPASRKCCIRVKFLRNWIEIINWALCLIVISNFMLTALLTCGRAGWESPLISEHIGIPMLFIHPDERAPKNLETRNVWLLIASFVPRTKTPPDYWSPRIRLPTAQSLHQSSLTAGAGGLVHYKMSCCFTAGSHAA